MTETDGYRERQCLIAKRYDCSKLSEPRIQGDPPALASLRWFSRRDRELSSVRNDISYQIVGEESIQVFRYPMLRVSDGGKSCEETEECHKIVRVPDAEHHFFGRVGGLR